MSKVKKKKNNKDLNVPTLRFPGFEDEWVEGKIGDFVFLNSDKYNPERETASYPCVELESISQDSGELLTIFDSKNQRSIKTRFQKGDVLFGKLRPYLRKYYLPDFSGVCSTEIWVLKSKEFHPSYLYAFVQSERFINLTNISSGSKMPRADWRLVSSSNFYYPNEAQERDKIGSLISLLNQRISTQSKIIEELKSLKNMIRKEIFAERLKFKDINGEFPNWETKKLKEVTYKVDKRNKSGEKLPIYSINNINGFVPQTEQFEGIDSNDRGYDISLYKVIEQETFAYNPARINVGSIGYSDNLKKVIISSLYVCFKTLDSINNDFFKHYLQTEHFKNAVLKKGEGGVRIYLFYENFAEITIKIPSNREQKVIAKFLSSIDNKIKTEHLLLREYEKQKDYLLATIFVNL